MSDTDRVKYLRIALVQKSRLISNLMGALKPVPRKIQVRQTIHFYMADPDYGSQVATGL